MSLCKSRDGCATAIGRRIHEAVNRNDSAALPFWRDAVFRSRPIFMNGQVLQLQLGSQQNRANRVLRIAGSNLPNLRIGLGKVHTVNIIQYPLNGLLVCRVVEDLRRTILRQGDK